jgi:hypothetical protein
VRCADGYCGPLVLRTGREIVFGLDFVPDLGAEGVKLANPSLLTSMIVKLKPASPGGQDRFEISLRALAPGKSGIAIRDASGKTQVRYDILILQSDAEAALSAKPRHDDLLFRGATPKDESVVFILSADSIAGLGLKFLRDDDLSSVSARIALALPEPIPADLREGTVLDLMELDLNAAAAEFDRKGARVGLVITGPGPISCNPVQVPVVPALGQSLGIQKTLQSVQPMEHSDFYAAFSKALELLKHAPTPARRIVLYGHCGNYCGDDSTDNYLKILSDLRSAKEHVRIDMRMYSADYNQEKALKEVAYYTGGTYLDHEVSRCMAVVPSARPPEKIHMPELGGPRPIPSETSAKYIPYSFPFDARVRRQPAPVPEPMATAPAPIRRPPVIPSVGDESLSGMGIYHVNPSTENTGTPAPGAGAAR